MKPNGWTFFSLLILALGVAFWLWMGLTYGSWSDVGVYSIGITFIGFGLLGTLVSLADKPRTA